MSSPTLETISEDMQALYKKIDGLVAKITTPIEAAAVELESRSFWPGHLGWVIACAACAVAGWMAHGQFC